MEASEGKAALITEFRKQTEEERRTLCERLRQARLDAGMLQGEAATRLGIAQSVLSQIESGERRLDMAELKALAKLYKRSPAWFMRDGKRSPNGDGEPAWAGEGQPSSPEA